MGAASPAVPDIAVNPTTGAGGSNALLLAEVESFRDDCQHRYRFNNGWDVTLSVMGLLLSIAVVAAGFVRRPEISAVLGAIVAAALSAQKAFPFGQRVMFYRLLLGQSENLLTRLRNGLLSQKDAVELLASLRMDFAQQLPRGSSAGDGPQGKNPHEGAEGSQEIGQQTTG
jgi:hypothetical protein